MIKITTKGHRSDPRGSLVQKIRKRGILGMITTLAAGGWIVYEIVHFILVEHYGLPDMLNDITIVGVLCVILSSMIWRWFRGEKKPRKTKWEFILIPVFILVAVAINVNIMLHKDVSGLDPYVKIFRQNNWRNAIAVLPFVNLSPEREQDYFCDGLTEEMITKLSQIRELKVTARTTAFHFKGRNRDIREIGNKLGVDKVLEGSVRKEGPRLRITAQLINVSDGFHLWSGTYDREMDTIIKIQDEIAYSVAGALKVTLLGDSVLSEETPRFEAYNEFLLGRYFYRNPTQENTEKALNHYKRAIELEPKYARAWVGLAVAQASQASFGYVPIEEGYPKAMTSVEQALSLDGRLGWAHAVLGWIQMTYQWDWKSADDSFQRALILEPGRGIIEAAQLALARGRFKQALRLAQRAVDLDVLNDSANMTLALTDFYSGRLKEASESFARVLEYNPDRTNAHSLLGQVFIAQADFPKALAEIEKEKDPFWRLPALAMAYHALGRKAESEAVIKEFAESYQNVGAYQISQIHAFRGEVDRAFEWLDKAYTQHDSGLFLVKPDPFLRILEDDPRYAAFLKKMRLPRRITGEKVFKSRY